MGWVNVKIFEVSYRIGTVGAGCCLYAHIYMHNIINDTVRLGITSTSGSQNGALKLHKTSWLDQNLSNRILKQLIDGASTTTDGKEFHTKYFRQSTEPGTFKLYDSRVAKLEAFSGIQQMWFTKRID